MTQRLSWSGWVFLALMLTLTGVFIFLGVWQLQRLAEKEALIASVSAGLASAPVPIEDVGNDPGYRAVTLSGTYIPDSTVLVFTSIADPKGTFGGPGYWVMTALALDSGGAVFVNRGFVPQERHTGYTGGTEPAGPQTLTGVARAAEASGSFTPAPDTANAIDWVRDPERLAAFAGDLPAPLLPITVDLDAGPPGTLPQGGETVVEFPNNHLGYAYTWFGFALVTPIMLFFWLLRQRRPKTP